MEKKYFVENIDQLDEVTDDILKWIQDVRIILFYGDMGAGKTTMIKSFCKNLGFKEEVQSPTFSIINEYNTPQSVIYHMDLYRLETEEQLTEIGFEEYIYSGAYCFIEWPKISIDFISEPYCKLNISSDEKGTRKIAVKIIK